jgi:hypothetical protein
MQQAMQPVLQPHPVSIQNVSPGIMRVEFLRRAERELNLNPEQRERIDGILKASQERTRKITEPIAPELRAELQRTREEFRDALTPEQRSRFDEMLKQQQQSRPRDMREPHDQRRPVPPGVESRQPTTN